MNKLGDYIDIKTGKRDANEACPDGSYPFFTCAKEPSRIDFWSFDCECVLVAGNCNPHVSYYNGKFNAYQRVYVIQSRDKKLLNIKYLYYFLKKYMTLVLDKQRGAIEKFFCLDDFTDIKIHLPDLPTQLRIAAILGSIDEKIELNRKKIAELESLAKTIYDYWFVQFDFPDKNGNPYKSSGGKMVWSEQLKREIPEGWEAGTVGDYVEIHRGASPRPIQNFLSNTGLRWLKISDATNSNSPYIIEIEDHIRAEGITKTVALKSGDLVLSNSASPGIPKFLGVDTCIHDGWLYFPRSEVSYEFLYLYFNKIKPSLIPQGNGSVFKNLKTDILKVFPMLKPSQVILDLFDNVIKPIFAEIFLLVKVTKETTALRDSLLPILMNGQVEVKE
jgi:type I restriction enzyme S subunit